MYIVNTSFMIEPPVHGRWYEFFTEKFMPRLAIEGFEEFVFTRVLTDNRDPHYTYSLQVHVPDIASYQRFMQDMMGEYSSIVMPLFGEQALHFSTLLKKIEWPMR